MLHRRHVWSFGIVLWWLRIFTFHRLPEFWLPPFPPNSPDYWPNSWVCSVWSSIPRREPDLVHWPVSTLANVSRMILVLIGLIVDNRYRNLYFLRALPSGTKWSELLPDDNILSLEHVLKVFLVPLHPPFLLHFLGNLVAHIRTHDGDVDLLHPLKTFLPPWREAKLVPLFSLGFVTYWWCSTVIVKVQSVIFVHDPLVLLCLWGNLARRLSEAYLLPSSILSCCACFYCAFFSWSNQ